jgi:hypothetical protein
MRKKRLAALASDGRCQGLVRIGHRAPWAPIGLRELAEADHSTISGRQRNNATSPSEAVAS